MGCCGMQAGMWTKIWGEGAGNLNPWNAKKNVLYRNVRTRNGKAKLRNTGMQDMKAFRNACPIAHVWFIGCFLARYDVFPWWDRVSSFFKCLKSRAGCVSLKCFHVSHLCAFFKWCCVLHLRAGLPQKKFWFRIFAHRVFIFTSCFFVPLISAPSLPIGLCLTLCLLVKLSLRQEGGGWGGCGGWCYTYLLPHTNTCPGWLTTSDHFVTNVLRPVLRSVRHCGEYCGWWSWWMGRWLVVGVGECNG